MSNTTTPSQPDSLDDQLAILANTERRTILTHLQDTETTTATLDDLASVLASTTSLEREHARIQLHHIHLPKLAQTPLLSYDPDTTHVEYHGDPDLEALLRTVRTPETPQDTA